MISNENVMTDEELLLKIDDVVKNYRGQIDHLYEAVGMIVVGRLLGWRVMRLVSSRRCWTLASDLFGDPKVLMDDEGKYASKSVGLAIVKKAGVYWDVIKRNSNLALTAHERRLLE